MNLFQNLMERLRPLVGLKGWNYCVLWILSDDQRFLELIDCYCGGSENTTQNNGGDQFPVSSSSSSVLPCRDVIFQHPRTKSCELLAQLPSSMPLDSGIHAQALISNQPRWLNFSTSSDSSSVLEVTVGTRALIPFSGGLLELFATQHVSEDQQVMDFITSQCSILMGQETMINSTSLDTSFVEVNLNMISDQQQSKPFLADQDNEQKGHQQQQINQFQQTPVSPATALENLNLPYDISAERIHLCSPPMNFLQQFNYNDDEHKTNSDTFFEGSLVNEIHQDMMISTNSESMHMKFMESSANKEQQGNNDKDSIKQENGRSESISDCSDQNDDENDAKYRRKNGSGPQAKNLHAERRRRKRLNGRLYDLRALVPKISSLNKAAILGDAIEFVKELQKEAKELQDELEEHSDDEGGKNGNQNNIPPEILSQNGGISENGFHVGASQISCSNPNQKLEISHDKGQQMEVQVEVAQLDKNEFFVKVFCEHKPGGFVRLMEALDSLGLEVTNANITSFRGLVSNVVKVEKKDSEIVQADYVRDSLLELTRDPPRGWPEMAKASENGSGMDYHHHHHHHYHQHNGHVNSNRHHLHHLHS